MERKDYWLPLQDGSALIVKVPWGACEYLQRKGDFVSGTVGWIWLDNARQPSVLIDWKAGDAVFLLGASEPPVKNARLGFLVRRVSGSELSRAASEDAAATRQPVIRKPYQVENHGFTRGRLFVGVESSLHMKSDPAGLTWLQTEEGCRVAFISLWQGTDEDTYAMRRGDMWEINIGPYVQSSIPYISSGPAVLFSAGEIDDYLVSGSEFHDLASRKILKKIEKIKFHSKVCTMPSWPDLALGAVVDFGDEGLSVIHGSYRWAELELQD